LEVTPERTASRARAYVSASVSAEDERFASFFSASSVFSAPFSSPSPLSRFSRARSVVAECEKVVSASASSTRLVSPSVVAKANSM
jgi:hypothetical protein